HGGRAGSREGRDGERLLAAGFLGDLQNHLLARLGRESRRGLRRLAGQRRRRGEDQTGDETGESSHSKIRWTPRYLPVKSWGSGGSGEDAITARRAARSTNGSPLERSSCGSLIVPSRSIRKRIIAAIG